MNSEKNIVDAYLDGEMTPETERQLIEWLASDRENIRHFVIATHEHKIMRDIIFSKASQPIERIHI
jgi:hypothetical protein